MTDRPLDAVTEDVSLLPVLRALAQTYGLLGRISGRHIESLGLTPAQFDVITTLGDTRGMTCKALGECTLITKGTLTPVLDRLEAKGLVERTKSPQDGRQIVVTLTATGQQTFERTFMKHVNYMRGYLDALAPDRQALLIGLLAELRAVLEPRA